MQLPVTSYPVMQLPMMSLLPTAPPQIINGWCLYTTNIHIILTVLDYNTRNFEVSNLLYSNEKYSANLLCIMNLSFFHTIQSWSESKNAVHWIDTNNYTVYINFKNSKQTYFFVNRIWHAGRSIVICEQEIYICKHVVISFYS
jgi:hypothetical protein